MNEPPPKNVWERLNNWILVRFLLLFACGWAIVQLLAYFETIIVIFTCAAILAFLLSYPVRWLQAFIPRTIAIVLVFLLSLALAIGLIVTLGLTILSQGQQLLERILEFTESLQPYLERLEVFLQARNLEVDLDVLVEEIQNRAIAGIGLGLSTLQGVFTNFIGLILIAVISFFMLLDGEKIWDFFIKFFPGQLQNKITQSVRRNFLGFFRGRLILSVFFAASAFIVFLVLRVPFALFLAAIAGLFDLIPGIGATIGITIVSLIVLPQGIWLSIKVIFICVLLQQVEENVLLPHVMKGTININPVLMFFALLIGAQVAGLMGIFLSIPIAGVIVGLIDSEEVKE
jgi:predicted PurR-regulated permease PerM